MEPERRPSDAAPPEDPAATAFPDQDDESLDWFVDLLLAENAASA